MTCISPIQAYKPAGGSGRKKLIFKESDPDCGLPIKIRCKKCVSCRLSYSGMWAIRIMHETKSHEHNSFITLTYDEKYLPKNRSLNKKHFQKFMKSLRKKIAPIKIRYYHCGEYGEQLGRPHYHAIIFGYDFPDKKYLKTRMGNKLYTSELLRKVWKKGHVSVGQVSYESAAYVARYCVKKINGKTSQGKPEFLHYADIGEPIINIQTAEIYTKQKEYVTMSRRDGIGYEFYKKYKDDIYPMDEVVILGRGKLRPPEYYDRLYEMDEPEVMKVIKERRAEAANGIDYSEYTLQAKKKILESRLKTLKRSLG